MIILSASRWAQDLDALFAGGAMIGFLLSDRAVELLGALYDFSTEKATSNQYYRETRPVVLAARAKQASRIGRVVRWLRWFGGYDGFLTCGFKYVREAPLAAACARIGAPFVGWHKEFTVLEQRFVAQRVAESKDYGFRFSGTHLACVNDAARNLFIESQTFDPNRIRRVGLLRADNLFSRRDEPKPHADCVTLFSFGHLTGPFPSHPFRNYYFAEKDDLGFVTLFRRTHAVFAELALAHPDIGFLIKPKNVEPGWFGEIETVIEAELGQPLSSIPNCRIVGDPAPDLMARSFASICLNSTTVLESRAVGRNTILPLFAEAAEGGVHADMVYFRDFQDVFAVAESEARYRELIERAVRGERLEQGSEERFERLLERQLGNADGRAAERLHAYIREALEQERAGAGVPSQTFETA